jgi:protein-S-isoprenylcysteine O-methyltransferase Ste14
MHITTRIYHTPLWYETHEIGVSLNWHSFMNITREDRGGRWVVAQGLLIVLAIAAPRWEGAWPPAIRRLCRAVGLPLALAGATFLAAGSRRLGRNLTPLPKPTPDSVLVEDGIYGVVRHPIYTGVICMLLGRALATGRLARVVLALAAVCFFDAKARHEEAWLIAKFPGYTTYRHRVPKLIPGLY